MWYVRNRMRHGGSSPRSMNFINWCFSELDEFKRANLKSCGILGKENVRWLSPPANVTKINTDAGVSNGDKSVGLRIVARNHKGLCLASNQKLQCFVVESDCAVAISLVKNEENSCTDLDNVIIDIRSMMKTWKSTLACAVARGLHMRGKLTYILDGDNVRHGLNKDLTFKEDDVVENTRRIGEVAKLFADAGVISIASLISPYRKDRDACRALLQEGDFIEVFMDIPLQVCEARDPKGLYKLARAGKIKGFTGVEDPYEPPLKSEIVLQQKEEICPSPSDMADIVISYLERKGYLQA
ncbi:hypothetical protein AgCh_039875 [Apium graveolens]